MDDTRDEVDEILAGMTGGRTGTAGGVSSPVPPAADWAPWARRRVGVGRAA